MLSDVSDGRRGGVSNATVGDAIWTRHSICFVLQSSACPPSILATHSPVLVLDTIRTQIWDCITLSTTRLTMTECVVSAGRSPSRALQLRISCVHSFHRDRTRADDASSTDDEMPVCAVSDFTNHHLSQRFNSSKIFLN